MKTHHITCPLCEAMCGLTVLTQGREVVSIRGDTEDPFSRGHICPKAPALVELHRDPDRLRQPAIKMRDGKWRTASWGEAIERAAQGLVSVQEQHGTDAVGVYLGNPTVHSHGALLFVRGVVRALRTKNRFSATSVDQLPHHLAAYGMFGHQLLLPIPDIDRTDCFIILGGNPLASNGSIMTAPDVKRRMQAVQARGGKIVVIDPRRTETADVADRYIPIRPGTDAVLLASMLRLVFHRNAVRLRHLTGYVDGLNRLKDWLEPFTLEAAAARTGVDPDSIEELVSMLVSNDRAVVYGRLGTCTQAFGGLCHWLINTLNLVTGHLDAEGGAMFPEPAFDLLTLPGPFRAKAGSHGRSQSRVRGLDEFGGELPVSVLSEEMETEGPGQIRALFTHAGNPVLSTPGGHRLEKAVSHLDFMVSVDFYLNETTRFADVILPPVSPLERSHYDVIFHMFAVRNTAKHSQSVFPKSNTARYDWEILVALERAILRQRGRLNSVDRVRLALLERLGPDPIIDMGLRAGPYGSLRGRSSPRMSLKALRNAPHGVDLGPLRTCLLARMPKDKIVASPPRLESEVQRLIASLQDEPPAWTLIGRRHLRSNNSWMHNLERLNRGRDRCTLQVHPRDAGVIGVEDRDRVRVMSATGTIVTIIEINDGMMPGVVSLPHGYGHGRDGVKGRVARRVGGVSVNDLTDPSQVDEFSGNAILNGVPVRLERVDATEG
ncbi:MAG: molybdopterin oxidoreductase family protein [Myxococcota bacterium]